MVFPDRKQAALRLWAERVLTYARSSYTHVLRNARRGVYECKVYVRLTVSVVSLH